MTMFSSKLTCDKKARWRRSRRSYEMVFLVLFVLIMIVGAAAATGGAGTYRLGRSNLYLQGGPLT